MGIVLSASKVCPARPVHLQWHYVKDGALELNNVALLVLREGYCEICRDTYPFLACWNLRLPAPVVRPFPTRSAKASNLKCMFWMGCFYGCNNVFDSSEDFWPLEEMSGRWISLGPRFIVSRGCRNTLPHSFKKCFTPFILKQHAQMEDVSVPMPCFDVETF